MSGAATTVAVVGGGNFGTVIANIMAAQGSRVRLWMRDPEQVADVRAYRENRRYLPGHRLHERVEPGSDLGASVEASEIVFVAVPRAPFRSVTAAIGAHARADALLVSCTKGIEPEGFRLMSQVLAETCQAARIGVLSGPNIAEEIATGHFTGTVIASEDAALRARIQAVLHSRSFRVYSNPDTFGVELGGALKNIYALASGMAAALGAGQNARSMLITRSLAEMSRFGVSLGANPLTFLGLSGVGDLMVTCTSPLSRNYRLGYTVGLGRTLAAAQVELGKLTEGVDTLRVVWREAQRREVAMPIVQGLHAILFEGRPLPDVLARLMIAEERDDVEFVLPEGPASRSQSPGV